jgi:acetyl-CoA C-acetyltransferase
MSTQQRSPLLVGVAQVLQPKFDPEDIASALDPLQLIREATTRALNDAHLLPSHVDTVAVIDSIGWQPANAAALVADACSISASRLICAPIGGNTPQALINRLSRELAEGKIECALLVGANALASIRAWHKLGQKRQWSRGGDGPVELIGDARDGSSAYERAYGLELPTKVYPLFENALRAARGLSIDEHARTLGAMLAPFTAVAASNPYAWFPHERSAEEITTATQANRFVGFPYTKYMNAIMDTDQSAAVVLTTQENASKWAVPDDKRVWFLGGADAAEDPWIFSERPSLAHSPALAACAQGALSNARTTVDAIDHFDLYSCFPVAVELACDALGISETDPRGLTVTGGLPYFGGPGNAYSLHAVASMADRLRANRGGRGLVTGNGWFFTKHSAGVYSGEPGAAVFSGSSVQAPASCAAPGVPLVEMADGAAAIETYTVNFGRDGKGESAAVIGRLEGGERFIALTPPEEEVFQELTTEEGVGRLGRVSHRDGKNVFDLS